jgi:hypothetical protein
VVSSWSFQCIPSPPSRFVASSRRVSLYAAVRPHRRCISGDQ